jgi:hypothetical protein
MDVDMHDFKHSKWNIFLYVTNSPMSRDSVVGIATGYGLDDRGVVVRVPVESRIFSSPHRPDRLWGPPILLSNGYPGSYPEAKETGIVKLTTHLHLVPRSRKCGSIHPLPICLHGIISKARGQLYLLRIYRTELICLYTYFCNLIYNFYEFHSNPHSC